MVRLSLTVVKLEDSLATEYSSVRTAPIAPADTTARIFIDNSVFEIFINDGEMVFSGRVFHVKTKHIFQSPRETYWRLLSTAFIYKNQTKKEDPIGSSFLCFN